MDFIIKFTIGLFLFSILLLFFKSTKKISENYYDDILIKNENNIKTPIKTSIKNEELDKININNIKWKIN